MTPKEKVKELIEKFEIELMDSVLMEETQIAIAKQCALICVDEILRELHYHDPHNEAGDCTQGIRESKNYWQEIKQEIENYNP